jgi:hypothetical protein
MCLGNSISEGLATKNTYRSYLYTSLVSAGYQVDFVGDNKGTCGNRNAGTQDHWDDDHCCFYSAKASQILDGNMPVNKCSPAGDGNIHDWAPRYKPDIAIIHLGTNDCRGGVSVQNIQKSLEGIIGELRKSVPEVKIIVSQIITSRNESVNKKIILFNASLPAWVQKTTTQKSPLVLVDQESGWDPAKDNRDEFHPSATGAKKMADKFLPAVEKFITQQPTSTPPVGTSDQAVYPTIKMTNNTITLPTSASDIASLHLHSLSGKFLGTLQPLQPSSYTLPKAEPNGFYLLRIVRTNGVSYMQPITIVN